MKSADKSIIPAFNDRVNLLGYSKYVHSTKTSVECLHNDGRVDFAGIKTSSGNQSAALKSLENYSVLIVDECEEWESYDEFEKIELSIRSKDVQPVSIIVMNPCDESHFVYQKFFKPNNIPNEFCGIVNGILFIHSSYLDLGEQYVAKKNWKKFEKARLIYEKVDIVPLMDRKGKFSQEEMKTHAFYKYKVLGHWQTKKDNLCIEYWDTFTEWPEEEADYTLFGLDFGTSPDPNALVETSVYGNNVYVKEHVYMTEMLNSELADAINDAIEKGRFEEMYVVADHAQKQNILELAKLGIYIIKCKKGAGSIEGGLQKLRSMNLFIHEDSKNIQKELYNYHYVYKTNLLGEMKVVPIDKDNHLIDSLRYSLSIY
jgi:phage terminase large subunit